MARMFGDDWLLPVLEPHNHAFFTAGTLMVQTCRACGSHDVGARASAGLGRIESVAVVHHAVHPLLKAHTVRIQFRVLHSCVERAATRDF